jgi:hypothetical protein
MARYDKYDGMVGNFRAPLAADWLSADLNTVFGVGLDANGRVVKGAGNSGVVGVICLTKVRKAGEIVDIMKHGEIVEADIAGPAGATSTGTTAGTAYYADATTGAMGSTAPLAGDNGVKIGHTVEASRLVVNVADIQTAD